MAAGLAQLQILARTPEVYSELERRGALLEAGLRDALRRVPVQVNRVGSVLTVFFTQEPVTGYAQARQADTVRFAQWYRGLLARGIYVAPSQFEAMFLSAAHTDAEIGRVLQAARAIF